MEFQPRTPREGINVSNEHPLKEASVLIVGLTAVFAVIALVVIFFVDLVVPLIPADAEARATSAWIPEDIELQEDLDVEPVQNLIDRLAAHWPDCPYQFRAGVFSGDGPNALALPGGLILVTSELLDAIESENELAAVLGHEIGHYRHRDHLKLFGRGFVLNLLMAVTLGRSNSGMALGAQVSGLALNSFGREQETQADSFGLSLVEAEYGHVNDSWAFFERLGESDTELDRLATYLSTHPASSDRGERLRRLAADNGWSTEGPLIPWN